jgi:Na+(H+)/acetate symporter ActP
MILLTGVLVFVFYHFQPAPILWNSAALSRLERQAPAAELAGIKERYAAAAQRRDAAARDFARARQAGATADATAYRAAEQEFQAARGEAIRVIERIDGARYNDINYVFPSYIVNHLPRGLAGLVIAVIFAAAMSTLSGEFNSLATASMIDFYKRYVRPVSSDAHELLVSRIFTVFWGAFACFVALEAGRLGSAIEVVNKFGSYFYGSMLGVFGLAVLAPRASATGAFWGLLIGIVTVGLVANLTAIHFLWYNLVGALTVFASGLAITALAAARKAA